MNNKRLIIIGIFLIAVALVFTPFTSFYPSGSDVPGWSGLIITGIIFVVSGFVFACVKRNRNVNH